MLRDLGNSVAFSTTLAPQTVTMSAGGTTTNGSSVDRLGYESAVFVFANSAPYGTPTGVTVTFKVQDSDDDSTFTDVSGYTDSHNVTNTSSAVEINVADLGDFERYVRGVCVSDVNGGTGPFCTIAGGVVLGSPKTYPV